MLVATHPLFMAPFYIERGLRRIMLEGRTVPGPTIVASTTTSGHGSPIPVSRSGPSIHDEISRSRKQVKQRISGVPENGDCANFSVLQALRV